MIIGYTTGVFDLFHIGHLNILRSAKALCNRLIVGVSTDDLVREYKGKYPIIPYEQRSEIVRSIYCVDAVVRREIMDKMKEWHCLKFDIAFVGDDWYANTKWQTWEHKLLQVGVKTIYLPHTDNISTTMLVESIRCGGNQGDQK